MKKLVSIVLALAMILMVGAAFANTITIESKAPEGQENNTTYTWYKILNLEKDSNTTLGTPDEETGIVASADLASPVSYYVASPANDTLASLLNATTYLKATKSADGTRWNIELVGSPTGAQLAETLNTDAIKTAALATGTANADGQNDVVIDNLTDGYYLIVASNGINLIAQSLGDVTIKEKNTYIINEKEVEEADLAIGEVAHFTITVTIPSTSKVGETVTVHDTMDSELTYNNDLAATFNNASVTLTNNANKTAAELFAVDFTIAEGMPGNTVVLTYSATVNETADPDNDGFVNQSFANDSNFTTLPTEVRVYTFDFNLDKNFIGVTGDDAANFSATFNLKKDDTVLKFKTDSQGYLLALDQDDEDASADLEVNGLNNINIRGLDAGDYELIETATASGYNMLTEAIDVKIVDDTPAASKNDPSVTPTYHVEYKLHSATTYSSVTNLTVVVDNQSGTQLPSTGGIGTTIFYILGGLLVVGAAVILVARRKAQD